MYFNRKGQETSLINSKTEFKTYVKDSDGNYQLVAMPNVIKGKGGSNNKGGGSKIRLPNRGKYGCIQYG